MHGKAYQVINPLKELLHIICQLSLVCVSLLQVPFKHVADACARGSCIGVLSLQGSRIASHAYASVSAAFGEYTASGIEWQITINSSCHTFIIQECPARSAWCFLDQNDGMGLLLQPVRVVMHAQAAKACSSHDDSTLSTSARKISSPCSAIYQVAQQLAPFTVKYAGLTYRRE